MKKEIQALILPLKDSPYFSEAQFIIKRNAALPEESEAVREAERIVESYERRRGRARGRAGSVRSPLFYFLCGIGVSLVCFAVFSLFRG